MKNMGRYVIGGINKFLRFRQHYKKIIARAYWETSDVYLVSYPKSGATWVCLIFANILQQLMDGGRRIDFFSVHDYVPDLHWNPERIIQMSPPRIIKTHESFEEWDRRISIRGKHIIFPRVIYLVRDGRDAIVSYYHYVRALHGYRRSFEFFINDAKIKRGDWAEHVKSWIIQNPVLDNRQILMIKYEDLCTDTIKEVIKMIDFIGLEVNENILESAIKNAHITNISRLEQNYGSALKYKIPEYRFARKGTHGDIEEEFKKITDLYFKNNSEIFKFLRYK